MRTVHFLDDQGLRREGRWTDESIQAGNRSYDPEDVSVLPPCTPSKIICIGRNYADHAAEMNSEVPDRPLLFVKTPNTVTGHDRTVRLPDPEKEFEHEAELGVVMDRQAYNIESAEAMDYVRGCTAFNDLSNRTDQRQEQNWVRGKAFDGAAPIGPVLVPPDEVPEDAKITCRVNGELRQQSRRSRMIFTIPELIEEITSYLTLEAGDVIATGTPPGVSSITPGDRVEVSIDGIGTLRTIIAETP